VAPTRETIEENRRSFSNLADSNGIERSVPDTVLRKTSVFIWVTRLKKVLIELFRHPVPELESLV
jgi:hypothetical protein